MTPLNIIGLCLEHGVDIIAVTDHNTGANVRAVSGFAEGTGVTVWPGMEVQTREEVHLVVLAGDMTGLAEWEDFISRHLPDLPNRPRLFGEQLLFDSQSKVIGSCSRLLLTSADLSVDQVRREAGRRGLVCYPAHIDRPAYSYISNLGFPPAAGEFDLVEVSSTVRTEEVTESYPALAGYTVISSSDAHRLADLGPAGTVLHLAAPSLEEFRLAVAGCDGRRVELLQ